MVDKLLRLLNWLSYGDWPLDLDKWQLTVRLLAWLARLITLFAMLLAVYIIARLSLFHAISLLLSTVSMIMAPYQ